MAITITPPSLRITRATPVALFSGWSLLPVEWQTDTMLLMQINPDLLDTSRGLLAAPGDLYAALNAQGLYNSRRFILRLSPNVHGALSTSSGGFSIRSGVDWETMQAMSTYLHETVHWWQHVGTTTGLFLSLTYPAQALGNYNAVSSPKCNSAAY
jgi:hypothetical protein